MPLGPDDVVAMLRLLSVDVRALAVLDAQGTVLAGDPAVVGASGVRQVRTARGTVVLDCGPHVLEPLLTDDVERLMRGLER